MKKIAIKDTAVVEESRRCCFCLFQNGAILCVDQVAGGARTDENVGLLRRRGFDHRRDSRFARPPPAIERSAHGTAGSADTSDQRRGRRVQWIERNRRHQRSLHQVPHASSILTRDACQTKFNHFNLDRAGTRNLARDVDVQRVIDDVHRNAKPGPGTAGRFPLGRAGALLPKRNSRQTVQFELQRGGHDQRAFR